MVGPTNPVPSANLSMPEKAIGALNLGSKLEAIKIVREVTGVGLKEAKDLVESYIAGQPHLASKFSNEIRVTAPGCILLALAVLAVIFTAVHVLSRKG